MADRILPLFFHQTPKSFEQKFGVSILIATVDEEPDVKTRLGANGRTTAVNRTIVRRTLRVEIHQALAAENGALRIAASANN